jgi:hypothetical protein
MIQTLSTDTNTTELYNSKMEKVSTMEDAIVDNTDDYVRISSKNKIEYYGNNGQEISSNTDYSGNNLFAKYENGKWGFVDNSNNIKIAFEYDNVTEFNEYGFAGVCKDGIWGALDASGNIVIEPTYQLGDSASNVDFIGMYYKVQNGYGNVYYTNDK